MGQYFYPVILRNNEFNRGSFFGDAHEHDYGLKLTEHSWVGNYFVGEVLNNLQEGDRLFWMGDYANVSDFDVNPDCTLAEYDRTRLCDYEQINQLSRICKGHCGKLELRNRYIINKTKKEYIDMEEYIAWAPKDEYGDMLQPVPLLTAVGNGKGGGDYFGPYDRESVGYWAGDEIYTSDAIPEGKYRNASKDYLFYEYQLSEEDEARYFDE